MRKPRMPPLCLFEFALPLMTDRCALREPVPTTDVAKAILFLASESWSGHITGQVLDVDSGKQGKVMWPPEASK